MKLIIRSSILKLLLAVIVQQIAEAKSSMKDGKFVPKGRVGKMEMETAAKQKEDDDKKLFSIKTMLADPHLEKFKFIYHGSAQSSNADSNEIPARNFAVIKYSLDNRHVRRIFKVKVKLPSGIKKQRKIKGKIVYPTSFVNKKATCQWAIGTGTSHGVAIIVPENCMKFIPDLYKTHLRQRISAILIPRQKRIPSKSIRQILKQFTVVRYGKRMGNCLKIIATKNVSAKLVLPKRRWQRRYK